MPGFNGNGPVGIGPTGRGFGPCGLGWRRRSGPGRGLGRYFGWAWPQTKEDQKKALAEYEKALREELDDVRKEKEELGKGK